MIFKVTNFEELAFQLKKQFTQLKKITLLTVPIVNPKSEKPTSNLIEKLENVQQNLESNFFYHFFLFLLLRTYFIKKNIPLNSY